MRKIIAAAASVTAIAALTLIPSIASADVPRCQAAVTDPSTATFTMLETRGEGGQWHSDFTVVVDPSGKITSGTVDVYGVDPAYPNQKLNDFTEIVQGGQITQPGGVGTKNYVSLTATRDPNVIDNYSLTNAPMDGITTSTKVTYPTPYNPEVVVSAPIFTASTTTDLNHGQYVKSQGGGKEAAQACAGMPLNSTQGKK
jgi:hypothetical protein